MTCPECRRERDTYPCACGYAPKTQIEANSDEVLTMKSGLKLHRCVWVTLDRCCLPASGKMPGQPRYCHWHAHWKQLVADARTLEERIERPAYDAWWRRRETGYDTHTSWGLNQEEYWRYAHGQRIHDAKPETLPVIAETPAYLSLDEFGQDLFAAIKAQAGSIQAFKTAQLYREKGCMKQADEYEHRAIACQRELEALLNKNTIADEDVVRILAMNHEAIHA
jgi:hypothetical protein